MEDDNGTEKYVLRRQKKPNEKLSSSWVPRNTKMTKGTTRAFEKDAKGR